MVIVDLVPVIQHGLRSEQVRQFIAFQETSQLLAPELVAVRGAVVAASERTRCGHFFAVTLGRRFVGFHFMTERAQLLL